MDERGASPEFQQDQAEAAERRETLRRDRELERMIRAIPMTYRVTHKGLATPRSQTYTDEVVAIVRRHNAELVAALARKNILIDHLERLIEKAAAVQGRTP